MLNYEFPPIGGGAGNAHLALLKEYARVSDLKIDVLTSGCESGFFKEKKKSSMKRTIQHFGYRLPLNITCP